MLINTQELRYRLHGQLSHNPQSVIRMKAILYILGAILMLSATETPSEALALTQLFFGGICFLIGSSINPQSKH